MDVHKFGAARTRRTPSARSGPVLVMKADPLIMALAIRIAKGDRRRLVIISPTQVLVQNRPRGRKEVR